MGCGWNDETWPRGPHRKVLDVWEGQRPVSLSKCDGHSYWFNTKALEVMGFLEDDKPNREKMRQFPKAHFVRDERGNLSGVVSELDWGWLQVHWASFTDASMSSYFLKAQSLFQKAGVVAIRDMTSSIKQIQTLLHMEKENQLKLLVHAYIKVEDLQGWFVLKRRLHEILPLSSERVFFRGIKLFLDGSLSSSTAHISEPYERGGQGCGRSHFSPMKIG